MQFKFEQFPSFIQHIKLFMMYKVFKNNHEVKLEQKLHDINSHQKVELKLTLK